MGRPEYKQALVRLSCSLSRTISIANRTWLEAVDYPGPSSLTLAREHRSQGVNGEEEHFCDIQSIGHRRIVLPKVQASINPVRSARRTKRVRDHTWRLGW